MNRKDIAFITMVVLLIFSLGINTYLMNLEKASEEIPTDLPKEIERKWIVNEEDIPYDLTKADVFEVEQSYISFDPEIRIRRVNNGEFYTLTIKSNMSVDGMVRDEVEYYIEKEAYELLLSKKEGITILKTRYQIVDEKGIKRSIDIFQGDLSGLVYLETEYKSEEEANQDVVDWVIKDVTSDKRYKNQSLARYGIPDNIND